MVAAFTFEEVGDLLNVSRQTIDTYVNKGLGGVLLESLPRGAEGAGVWRKVSLEQLLRFCANTKYKDVGRALAAQEPKQEAPELPTSGFVPAGDDENHLLSLAFERSSRIAAESQLAVAQAELSRLREDVQRLNGDAARLRRALQALLEENVQQS